VIVNNFNIESIPVSPNETNSELPVDANAVLPQAIPNKRFEVIPWGNCQILESQSSV
jgi:hypothetical protein